MVRIPITNEFITRSNDVVQIGIGTSTMRSY